VTIRTVGRDVYVFQAPKSKDFRNLVRFFLRGLSHRSSYLLATAPVGNRYRGQDALECRIGDLLLLFGGETWLGAREKDAVEAENVRTGLHGLVPTKCVRVIATNERPGLDLLV